jgi:HAD superfamily hydrolase (TIGR01509 family)
VIKAIIFDCFGVVQPDNFQVVYEKFGGNIVQDEKFINEAWQRHFAERIDSADIFAEHLKISRNAWLEALRTCTAGYDEELVEYIQALRKRYKVGMLSNVRKDGLLDVFTQEQLDDFFDAVVASGNIGYAKPEAQAYEIMADRLGVLLSECVFTDDREEYCDGAKAVGMKVIQYRSFEQFKPELETILSSDRQRMRL